MEAIDEIRAKSIRANLKLIECPIRLSGYRGRIQDLCEAPEAPGGEQSGNPIL